MEKDAPTKTCKFIKYNSNFGNNIPKLYRGLNQLSLRAGENENFSFSPKWRSFLVEGFVQFVDVNLYVCNLFYNFTTPFDFSLLINTCFCFWFCFLVLSYFYVSFYLKVLYFFLQSLGVLDCISPFNFAFKFFHLSRSYII